jgi:predicted transcriptional regulator
MSSEEQAQPNAVTVRLEPELLSGLDCVIADRLVKGVRPRTRSAIVREVLAEWLERHGYLKRPSKRD